MLNYHPVPLAAVAAGAPEVQYVPFVPNALGETLNPRRFKFAPRAMMANVMPAGKAAVRRDNLVR